MSDKNTAVAALTSKELTRLQQAEAVIERGKTAFVEVGLALTEIRDSRLYRDDYGTFEDYCQKRWGFERRRAYQLMDAARVVENVKNFTHSAPQIESHAASLSKLQRDEQPRAWGAAVSRAKSESRSVTAKDVEIEVSKVKGIPSPGRADWELNKTPAPKEHDPDDEDSDALFHLKRYWRRASKKDRNAFLRWVNKSK